MGFGSTWFPKSLSSGDVHSTELDAGSWEWRQRHLRSREQLALLAAVQSPCHPPTLASAEFNQP